MEAILRFADGTRPPRHGSRRSPAPQGRRQGLADRASRRRRSTFAGEDFRLLADPIDDVRRAAIRTVGHARFAPAVPALVVLLTDRSPTVRRAAAEALVHLGEASRGALRHALAGARPDRRGVYAQVLERLGTGDA